MRGTYIYVICEAVVISLIVIIVNNQAEFLEPDFQPDQGDVFEKGVMEYIFVHGRIAYYNARETCRVYPINGRLALVPTLELAEFLAEAISETTITQEMWVAAQRNATESWAWYADDDERIPVEEEIIQSMVNYSEAYEGPDRHCLAMGRKDHDIPYFPSLNCSVLRPVMCERNRSAPLYRSTHPGWIQIEQFFYKIFSEHVSWADAEKECFIRDKESSLAVVPDFKTVQHLGRHLLIGRPSLENAWIGASYENNSYIFLLNNMVLPNDTDATGYPPWRNGTIQKKFGCLLLDRHLSNISLFVEARCDRFRAYICSKKIVDEIIDIIIDGYGYRLFPKRLLTWHNAKKQCDEYKLKYNGKLAEIAEPKIVDHLLTVMGVLAKAIRHIWLGGKYARKKKWTWVSDGSLIDTTILGWIKNTTYEEEIDMVNLCLNMDRENLRVPLHYGTNCISEQHFVCMFTADKLKQLQADEKANQT